MSNHTHRRTHAHVATVGSLVATLVAAGEARAAITVNANADPPGYNGPACTLRMAVAAVHGATNACGTGTTIQLGGPGATFITLTKSLGPLVLARSMVIQGNFGGQHPDFDTVVISADPINGGQIFSIPAAPITLSLSYLRLANGREPTVNGGAISERNQSGGINLNVVQIDHCSGANGGAVYAKGQVSITASSLHDNVGLLGGALFFETDSAIGTITSTTFSKNVASQPSQGGGLGGAIYLSQSSVITVQSSTFFQNSAIYGGGIANFGHLEVYGSTFESNRANSTGGAIHGGGGDMIVGNDTITLNAASAGGGVFWNRINAGYFELDRTTIVSNSGTGAGGGIDINGTTGGTNKIGGQNIIAQNTSNNGPDILGDLAGVGGINLIGNGSGITSCPAGWIVADPLLGAYASVNNQPKSYALQSVSPAIDRGTPIPGFLYDGVDQTAQGRPVVLTNGATPYDLGSFELR